LDARYTSFYGIVDYLKMPVRPNEVIEMTGKILGSGPVDVREPEEDAGFMEDETPPVAGPSQAKDEYSFDTEAEEIPEIARPNEEYSYNDEKEELRESLLKKSMRRRPSKSGLFTPLLIVMAVIVILAAGFVVYKLFISKPEIPVSVAVKPPKAVQQQEPAVLPSPEQQKQEQPVAEGKTAVKNEVPKGAPSVAAPAAKAAEKPFHSVQLGAFKSEASAEALAKTYKGKGYDAFTHKGTAKDNKPVYRVLIDKFESRKEALQLAAKIQTKEKIKTTVFSGK
jgi:cell division septation protein DedD